MLIVDKKQAKQAFLKGCTIMIYNENDDLDIWEFKTRPQNKVQIEIRRFYKIVKLYRDYIGIPLFAICDIPLKAVR